MRPLGPATLVTVSSCQNPVLQGTVDGFVPNETSKTSEDKTVVISVARLGETRSIDVDIADIPWDRARQRDSSLEELWLCWEFGSYLALVMLHTFCYAKIQ